MEFLISAKPGGALRIPARPRPYLWKSVPLEARISEIPFLWKEAPMKTMIWLVLSAAVAVNVSSSVVFEGVQQVVVSVATGVLALTCAGALYAKRERRA
jgi:hypothetical protein